MLQLLLLSVAPALGPFSAQEADPALAGLFWGGILRPGDFETVVLELELTRGPRTALRAYMSRPYQGIGAQPLQVVSSSPRLVLEREDDGRRALLDCAPDGAELLVGEAHIGERSAPLVLRRVLALDASELDPFLGDYRADSGERIRVERLPVGTRHAALACTWTSSLRERTLFPVRRADDGMLELVFGPDFERPGPTAGRVRFAAGGSALEWRDVDGSGERAERFPIEVDARRIAAFVEAELASSGAPSFSIGVVHGDELVLARSFGVLNRATGAPATPDSLYQIASVTKVFTATLLVALRDQGLVSLDDPVARYLPEAAELPRGGEGITLRELVTHTSGLRPQPTNYRWNGRHNDDYTAELLYECLPETSLLFPRKSSWSYSNLGFVLLGHALARAGDSSYEELLRRHVLEPLGMSSSTITLDAMTRERLATHYWSDDPLTPTPPWIPGDIAAQGGLTSSVRDMARFLSASLRDERVAPGVLSGTSLQELQAPHARRMDGDGWMALGWFRDHESESGELLYHSGFTGGSSSYVALSPALEVGVIVLTNFGFDPALRVGRWLIEEAVRSAREQLVPSEHEARTWFARGDWSNAAWAYDILAELAPERGELRERAETARRRAR